MSVFSVLQEQQEEKIERAVSIFKEKFSVKKKNG